MSTKTTMAAAQAIEACREIFESHPEDVISPMLARRFETEGQSCEGWLVSEKLDGVRAIWTGTELVTRNGNRIHLPSWFSAALPVEPLDGELTLGRGRFQETAGIIRRSRPSDEAWSGMRYAVFDAPRSPGGFEVRLECARQVLGGSHVAEVLDHVPCRGPAHLDELLAEVVSAGGEGVMLRRPGSAYTSGRSWDLLKLKPHEDDEALVIGHEPGTGRLANMVGAILCRWRGRVVRVGAGIPDLVRKLPPQLGASVTFRFAGLTDAGLPRFPVFLAVRDYE